MTPLLLGVLFALCALVAWWRSSSEFGIDVTLGLAWLFGLLAVLGWGALGYTRYARDREFDQMWDIAWGVTVMGSRMGASTEGAMRALKDMESRFPVRIQQEQAPTAPQGE